MDISVGQSFYSCSQLCVRARQGGRADPATATRPPIRSPARQRSPRLASPHPALVQLLQARSCAASPRRAAAASRAAWCLVLGAWCLVFGASCDLELVRRPQFVDAASRALNDASATLRADRQRHQCAD
jgi:hypothetical protein